MEFATHAAPLPNTQEYRLAVETREILSKETRGTYPTGMLTSTDPNHQYTATKPAVRPKQHDDYWSSAASIGFEQDIAISRLSKLNGA